VVLEDQLGFAQKYQTAGQCTHSAFAQTAYVSPMQIVPSSSNGLDAVNFRHMKESNSLHLEDQLTGVAGAGVYSTGLGTPGLDDGLDDDLFTGFSSVTLHYDGDH
jgi:hypothetical protein